MIYSIYNQTQKRNVLNVRKAGTFWKRLVGLLFDSLKINPQAIWLVPSNAIHTFGMRYSVDLIFLDRNQKALKISAEVKPFSLPVFCWGAYSVLEIPNGCWNPLDISCGDQLEFRVFDKDK